MQQCLKIKEIQGQKSEQLCEKVSVFKNYWMAQVILEFTAMLVNA